MYPTITVTTDTMTARGIFLQERGREAHKEQAVVLVKHTITTDCSWLWLGEPPKLISSHSAFWKAVVPQRPVTQGDFFPALPFRSDQLFTHKASLKPAQWEETGREFEPCLGHQPAAHEVPSRRTYQPEYANMPA